MKLYTKNPVAFERAFTVFRDQRAAAVDGAVAALLSPDGSASSEGVQPTNADVSVDTGAAGLELGREDSGENESTGEASTGDAKCKAVVNYLQRKQFLTTGWQLELLSEPDLACERTGCKRRGEVLAYPPGGRGKVLCAAHDRLSHVYRRAESRCVFRRPRELPSGVVVNLRADEFLSLPRVDEPGCIATVGFGPLPDDFALSTPRALVKAARSAESFRRGLDPGVEVVGEV